MDTQNMKKWVCTVLLFSFSTMTLASEFFVMAEFGRTDIDFEEEYLFADFEGEDEAGTASFVGGVKFDSNIIFAGNVSTTASESFFGVGDEYQLYEIGALLGYSIDVAKHFRIVPAVGLNFWELDAEEDEFLNSGPEERRESHGNQFYYRINLEFPINKLFQLNFAYINAEYEFGDLESGRFGFKYSF